LQECFGTLLNPKKSLVNDFEHKFNLSCEIADKKLEIVLKTGRLWLFFLAVELLPW
jgi:hypothetical protein